MFMTVLYILTYFIKNCILFIADKVNKTSYVIVRSGDIRFKDVSVACCKYGFTIFQDDSVLNDIQLRTNESVYYPVWPIFKTSDKNVTVIHPWVSYEGTNIFFSKRSKSSTYILNYNTRTC